MNRCTLARGSDGCLFCVVGALVGDFVVVQPRKSPELGFYGARFAIFTILLVLIRGFFIVLIFFNVFRR